MSNRINSILVTSLLSSMLTGCIGAAKITPNECDTNNIPDLEKNFLGWELPKNKEGFLRRRSEPGEILHISEDEEIWVYERKDWCGAVLVYMLPAPFMLPVCDTFEHITFEGETVKRAHIRRVDASGFLIIWTTGGGDGRGTCPPDIEEPPNN